MSFCLYRIKASEEKKPKEKQKRPKGDEAKKLKVASKAAKHLLDCGDVVLKTGVDHLSGISNRHKHPDFAEPEVALIFGKPGTNLDTSDMEKTLHQAMRDVSSPVKLLLNADWLLQFVLKWRLSYLLQHPTSPHVYNHIGNFWRIRGNTRLAIQCFRKALSLSPNNSDVLLNLGRVLMNLKYDDDALVLTMQSLRMLQPGQNSWLQHFTLGEILKSRSIDEAAVHFRLALELNPGFSAAQAYLDDIEGGNIMFASPLSLSHIVTVLIATVVVLLFCYYLVKWLDSTLSEFRSCEFHYQRHFNRAMAMRSLRSGLNPKLVRARKQQQVG